MITRYKTIAAQSFGEYKEKGSRFAAYAEPVTSTDQVKQVIAALKREHPKARHHCFAYRIGVDGTEFRANDDGEPGGTAGKPILGQIDSFGFTNTMVVVVRYFGGVLLGVSGLNNAYKSAARLALESATVVEQDVMFDAQLSFEAEKMPGVMRVLKKYNASTSAMKFEAAYELHIIATLESKQRITDALFDIGITVKPL